MLLAIQAAGPGGEDNVLFWAKIGWVVAIALIGLVIWYFKIHRKSRN